ncbi:MAG: Tfp pilus assembly protein FimT/FimU [Huintestinicola sp.]|uniref:pilus assembly FimT family protein n=1 Tax=Huintestinicola sp. TaxID=2981661 RepID=UPI003F074053
MNNSKRKLRGFTLLELVIVIAILAIMAAILVPNISDYIRTNHIKSANSQAQQVYMAAQDYLISEQIKGTTAKDITGTATPPRLCWIMVNTEQGYDSTKYDKSNKTTVVDSFGIKQDPATGFDVRKITVGSDTLNAYPIADGIESRLESSFKGSWVVAFYPSTFTVAYAVYNDYYSTTAECEAAVKLIGTNGGVKDASSCDDRLYLYEFNVDANGRNPRAQESDFMHPTQGVTPHMYTGQFPVPVH